ncbi:MAG: hypothetical protein COZ06_28235 [Armatimonadetes bacterium CG_4_10_14_3_um_filter_66_18]|nr:DUF4058 family protein [Armatimonadota bacterium]OIO94991.1 MAG: hypothetical protein AUJ96_27745 [Armatimonadetes bacterium CG2_30_66_41]PIY40433.1 MAG: hypothetical protein COZ06_28235 [Armatimonadetes bacterium CG_4_10_14_3_um_filter_66_18]PJB69441.1 MAG: hypothetical protein CO096_13040 [Armatimonadetes bacterium CG_4_9_14_3_um_filter_66_14]NCO96107.1 DUF4058 family protein [Armatimonadota bacterium]
MPSPFPGIDPYLESPLHWSDFHESFITYCRDALVAQLPEHYRARIGERLSIETAPKPRYPDISIVDRDEWKGAETATVEYRTAAGPVGTAADPPVISETLAEGPMESYVQILDRAGDSVVTVIELLSPANKTPGEGQGLYLTKQRQLIRGRVHLVEIDLLCGGRHTVAIPLTHLSSLEPHYSLVCVSRAPDPGRFEVYPVQLRQRLPRIGVPLLPEDEDVVLDIQALYTQCYDRARYDRDLDYREEPPVSLSEEDSRWVRQLLSDRDLRCGPPAQPFLVEASPTVSPVVVNEFGGG